MESSFHAVYIVGKQHVGLLGCCVALSIAGGVRLRCLLLALRGVLIKGLSSFSVRGEGGMIEAGCPRAIWMVVAAAPMLSLGSLAISLYQNRLIQTPFLDVPKSQHSLIFATTMT